MKGYFYRALIRRVLCLTIALSPLQVLAPVAPVHASGTTITNCSNENDLKAAVLAGGLIRFNCGGTHAPATILLSEALAPISGTVLDGSNGGHTVVLDGQGNTRLIAVAASTQVTLTHLVLTHGASIDGSCLITHGVLELDDVEVHHCLAGAGNNCGGLYVDSAATATLNNAYLHDNSAGVSGGGSYSLGSLTVNSSTFAHNAAGADLGAVGDGGAIWASDSTYVSGTTFFSNTTAVGYGGGIYSQFGLSVEFSTLTDNTAVQDWGGIRNWTGLLLMNHVTFAGNQALDGGGLANAGTGSQAIMSSASFLGNQAKNFGGGVYNTGDLLDADLSVFKTNSAVVGGALANISPGYIHIHRSSLEANTAQDGGAIENRSKVLVDSDTLAGNFGLYGAGYEDADGTTSLLNDTLSGNQAPSGAPFSYGGGLEAMLGSRVTLQNDTLAGNSALTSGGAVYLISGAALTVTNTILAASPSGGNCGGAALASSHSSMSDDPTC